MLVAISAGMGIGLLSQQCLDRRVQVDAGFERSMPLPEVVNALRLGAKRHHPLLQRLQQRIVQALGNTAAS